MSKVEVDGVEVGFADSGDGAPVVLVHGSAGSRAHWRGVMEHLDGRFRLIAPELHGYGSTCPWPGRRPLRLADEAALVHSVIERAIETSGEPVHLVGHSYGGAVALRVAIENPESLSQLTLIEPAAFYMLRGGSARDQALFEEISAIAEGVKAAVVRGDYMSGMQLFVDYWNGPNAWAGLKPEVQTALARHVFKIAAEFSAIMAESAEIYDYRRITATSAILSGGASPGPVKRIAEMLAKRLPTAGLVTHETAGHMLPLTHPNFVSTAVAENHRRTLLEPPVAA